MDQIGVMNISNIERKSMTVLWTVAFGAALAAFSVGFLTHANTFALAEPIIRRLTPHASAEVISTLHVLSRKLGHFVIPAVAYLALVLGRCAITVISLSSCAHYSRCLTKHCKRSLPDGMARSSMWRLT